MDLLIEHDHCLKKVLRENGLNADELYFFKIGNKYYKKGYIKKAIFAEDNLGYHYICAYIFKDSTSGDYEQVRPSDVFTTKEMEKINMGNSYISNEEFMTKIKQLGFDTDNYVPIFVVFASDNSKVKTNYANSNKKYFYKIEKDSTIKVDDYVVVPVYNSDRFNVAKVTHIGENIQYETVPEIERLINDIDSQAFVSTTRSVVTSIGSKKEGAIKKHFDLIESEKRKQEIVAELEKRSKEAEKMFMYQQLAKTDSQMAKLLEELEEL